MNQIQDIYNYFLFSHKIDSWEQYPNYFNAGFLKTILSIPSFIDPVETCHCWPGVANLKQQKGDQARDPGNFAQSENSSKRSILWPFSRIGPNPVGIFHSSFSDESWLCSCPQSTEFWKYWSVIQSLICHTYSLVSSDIFHNHSL